MLIFEYDSLPRITLSKRTTRASLDCSITQTVTQEEEIFWRLTLTNEQIKARRDKAVRGADHSQGETIHYIEGRVWARDALTRKRKTNPSPFR